jgi:hypothetical protein
MNVAVLEPVASPIQASAVRERELEGIGQVSEWIDPEGDDWLAAIYQELEQHSASATGDRPAPELDHWFG